MNGSLERHVKGIEDKVFESGADSLGTNEWLALIYAKADDTDSVVKWLRPRNLLMGGAILAAIVRGPEVANSVVDIGLRLL